MSVVSYLHKRSSAAVLSGDENDSINTSIATLQSRLDFYFGDKLSSRFRFGSSTRGTILPRKMDEHSDIDYMVVWKEGGYKPQTYIDRLRSFADFYYSSSSIKQSSPTLVLELNHIKFDLVPALHYYDATYEIPNGTQSWKYTSPNDFNSTLENANKNNRYMLKPAIRLAKIWNAANGYVFDSFSFEKWIADRFFFLCTNQSDYLFAIFDSLSTNETAQWRNDRINRAKGIVANVRNYEKEGYPQSAEIEVKKLIPE